MTSAEPAVALALLRLLTWLSPAFPTGAYAYSHGLEWAVEAGDITSEATAQDWIAAVIANGTGWTDAILLRQAFRGADIAALAAAAAGSAERKAETLAQGTAFAIAASVWAAVDAAPTPVAVGRLAQAQGVSEDNVAIGLLHALTANLVSAAVRLVPLGQTAGLRMMRALEPIILGVVADTKGAGLDEIGGACFRSDIASMRHETQHTRLFRS